MKLHHQIILGSLLLTGCGPTTPPATEADIAIGVFRSTENLNTIKSAKKVTACRLKPPADDAYGEGKTDDAILGLYQEGKWIECSELHTERLKRVLMGPHTYVFDSAKSCFPRWGVLIRFSGEDEPIDINLCFECEVLAVVRDGKIVGGEDFDGGNRELVAICKELFPDDSEIQALKP